jgi:hypothetical protein
MECNCRVSDKDENSRANLIKDEMEMKFKGVYSIFQKASPPRAKKGRKSPGQSLVEVAIAFPVLIMLFAGVVEFGFILNFYLSLLDATRDAARRYSTGDPFDTTLFTPTYGADTFYHDAAFQAQRILDPTIDKPAYRGRRIVLNPAHDDVIVTVYGAEDSTVILRRTEGPYHLFPTAGSTTGNYPSMFTAQNILDTRVADAPDAGVLLVEVHYNYRHVLNLPWMTAWLPNPLHLQAYTIMPIRAGEP